MMLSLRVLQTWAVMNFSLLNEPVHSLLQPLYRHRRGSRKAAMLQIQKETVPWVSEIVQPLIQGRPEALDRHTASSAAGRPRLAMDTGRMA